jgi:chromosome segregation ATPase
VINNLREVSSLASNIISAVSSFASGNIVGGIVSVLGAISSGVSLISQLFDPYARKIAEATAEVERQERAYSRLQKEISNTLGKSDTAEKKAQAIAVQQSIIAALQEQLKAEQEKKQSWWDPLGWFTSGPDEETIAELTDAINDAYAEINSIVESMVDDFYGQDIDSIISKSAGCQ